jgi:hypothetical protein
MKGFWQIKVPERTEKYLTFSTICGRYCCQRLFFGLASVPEVFQHIMTSVGGVKNTEISIDDIF